MTEICFNEDEEINQLNENFNRNHDYIDFDQKIIQWFEKIDNDKDKYIYLKLLNNFKYYSRKNIIEALRTIHLKVLQFDKNVDRTIFFPMFSVSGRNNHSFEIHNMYREANNLNKECFLVNINQAIRNIPMELILNIVFIEDMIGSGKTIKKSIKKIYEDHKELFDKNIYILLLEVPEMIDEIEKQIKSEISDNINILFLNTHKKAFSNDFIFDSSELDESRERIKQYEKLLTSKDKEIFGYNNSEFLLSFFYDTPNNTITSLWKEDEKIGWKPPFSRNTKCNHRPSWLNNSSNRFNGVRELKAQKRRRKSANYNIKLRQD